MATTLSKVELIYNVLSLGYSPFWVDTDIVHFGNALPYLHQLDVDMAVGTEYCHTTSNFSAGYPGPFEQNTGTLYLRQGKPAQAFVLSWLTLQRQHLLEWGPEQFDKKDMFQRRSDQVGGRSGCQRCWVWCGASEHQGLVELQGRMLSNVKHCVYRWALAPVQSVALSHSAEWLVKASKQARIWAPF